MPTYEYACRDCGDHVEVVQSFKDDPLTVCPVCGGELRKVFGNIGIAFKGSGFYRNDSRSKTSSVSSTSGESKSDDGKSSESKSGDGKSSESKSGESKSGDGKSSESKSGESKSGEKAGAKKESSSGAANPSTATASAS